MVGAWQTEESSSWQEQQQGGWCLADRGVFFLAGTAAAFLGGVAALTFENQQKRNEMRENAASKCHDKCAALTSDARVMQHRAKKTARAWWRKTKHIHEGAEPNARW